jgi:hypothetical protein
MPEPAGPAGEEHDLVVAGERFDHCDALAVRRVVPRRVSSRRYPQGTAGTVVGPPSQPTVDRRAEPVRWPWLGRRSTMIWVMEILSSRVICHTDDLTGLRRFYEGRPRPARLP